MNSNCATVFKSAHQCVTHMDLRQLRKFCELAYNQQYDLEKVDLYGNTALLTASYLGGYEAVNMLLYYRANIRAMNNFGQNALTLAVYSGCELTVMELLKHRSYHDFNTNSIIPPLCVATLKQDNRMWQLLASMGPTNTEAMHTSHGLSPHDIQNMINQC